MFSREKQGRLKLTDGEQERTSREGGRRRVQDWVKNGHMDVQTSVEAKRQEWKIRTTFSGESKIAAKLTSRKVYRRLPV